MVGGPILRDLVAANIAGNATECWSLGNEFVRRTGDVGAFGSRLMAWIWLIPIAPNDYAQAHVTIGYSFDGGATFVDRGTEDVFTNLALYHLDVPLLGTNIQVCVTERLNQAIQAEAWLSVR